MDFDEQLELDHFVLTERKCRVCGKTKDLIDGFYLIRKNKSIQSSYSYECKTCTIQRVKSKKKVSINFEQQPSKAALEKKAMYLLLKKALLF